MSYNRNMEPNPRVRDNVSPEVIDALNAKDANLLSAQLQKIKDSEPTPQGAWAEALGIRLQVRDFLVDQKGGIAALQSGANPDLRESVTDFLQALDTRTSTITGVYGHGRPPIDPQELRTGRIDRLMREPDDSLLGIVEGFVDRPTDRVLSEEELTRHVGDLRNGMVERLWEVAQTYREGDVTGAQQELAQETETINRVLDSQISTTLQW